VDCGASTVRSELARSSGGPAQPAHTSAGRIPTDAGYRCYADSLLDSLHDRAGPQIGTVGLPQARREVEDALRETTAALAQANDLLALVDGAAVPARRTIHRVEVLVLQPARWRSSRSPDNGEVAKRVFTFRVAGRSRPRSTGLRRSSTSASPGSDRSSIVASRPPGPGSRRARAPNSSSEIGAAVAELAEATPSSSTWTGPARLLSETPRRRHPASRTAS
jgi:hypothetical protein